MKTLLIISILFCLSSCINKSSNSQLSTGIIKLLPDTSKFKTAFFDQTLVPRYNKIATQLNLTNISKLGTDSIEVRLWREAAFSPFSELFYLKGIDTTWTITYYKLYERQYDYDKPNRSWNPFTDPIIDSLSSKTVRLTSSDIFDLGNKFKIDSIWQLPSQCEIDGRFGGTDGEWFCMEIADMKRYKLVYYNNPRGEKEVNHFLFMNYSDYLGGLAYEKKLSGF